MKKKFRLKLKVNNIKLLIVILTVISVLSALAAAGAQYRYAERTDLWGDTRVYRATHLIELHEGVFPEINIYLAGMSVEVAVWEEPFIKVECVAELPLIITDNYEPRYKHEITIAQDDGFAISFMTLDLFRYHMKVYLPRFAHYGQINIVSSGGDVSVNAHHLRVREAVQIQTSSGTVSVVRPSSVYSITTRSGDVFMDFDFLVSEVEIRSYSGDVEVRVPDISADSAGELLFVRTQRGGFVLIEEEKIPLL
jgi:tellurite resistance-related uncharacterized protein